MAGQDIPVAYFEPNEIDFNVEDLNFGVKLEIEVLKRGSVASETLTATFMQKSEPLDMISSNGNVLTTSYTDISMFEIEHGGNKESIGVERINIKYNSWYFPEVNIKFIDVRGNSVFNPKEKQNDASASQTATGSFFNALFMFPYPVYKLTVKGYFGQPVTYQLTVKDMRSAFNSSTGNFEVSVDFIGYAYGYLTDIPARLLFLASEVNYANFTQSDELGTFQFGSDKGKPITSFRKLIHDIYNIQIENDEKRDFSDENKLIKYLSLEKEQLMIIKAALGEIFSQIQKGKDDGIITENHIDNNHTLKITSTESNDLTLFNNLYVFIEGKHEIIKKTVKYYTTVLKESINLTISPEEVEKFGFTLSKKSETTTELYITPTISNLTSRINEFILDIDKRIGDIKEINEYRIEKRFKDVVGWQPTIGNIFQVVLAHMGRLNGYMEKCIKNIEMDKNQRIFNDLTTDCNYNGENFSLPPFPAFYNNNNEYVWCGEVPKAVNLEERILVDAIIKAASNTKQKVENALDNYTSYQNAAKIYPDNWMIPTLLYDLRNAENSYQRYEVERLGKPMEGDTVPLAIRILALRIAMRAYINTGERAQLPAENFGKLEAYNMMRGKFNAEYFTHDIWTKNGTSVAEIINQTIQDFAKGDVYSLPYMNDHDIIWNGKEFERAPIQSGMECKRETINPGLLKSNYDVVTIKGTMCDNKGVLYLPNELKYGLTMTNTHEFVNSVGCGEGYNNVFPTNVEVRIPMKEVTNKVFYSIEDKIFRETFGDIANGVFENDNFVLLGGGFNETEVSTPNVNVYKSYSVFSEEYYNTYSPLYNDNATITNCLDTLLPLFVKPVDYFQEWGGIYKIHRFYLMVMGKEAEKNGCVDGFQEYALKFYLENKDKFVKMYRNAYNNRGEKISQSFTEDTGFGSQVLTYECYGVKNTKSIKDFMQWLFKDPIFVYNANGGYYLGEPNKTPNAYTKKHKDKTFTDTLNIGDFCETSTIVREFLKTVRNECGIVLPEDVVITPSSTTNTSERSLAVYDVLKQLYDRWKIGDEDAKIDKLTLESFNDKFVFRDTFNNDISDKIKVNLDKLLTTIYSVMKGGDNNMSVYSFLFEICSNANCLLTSLPTNVFATTNTKESLRKIFTPYQFSSLKKTTASTVFVVTYNHKYSQHLDYNAIESSYKDDGVNFKNYTVCKQDDNNSNQLGVFGVTYGLGSQKYFNNPQISMDKPQVTEQSIASLLSIAESGNKNTAGKLQYEHHDLFDTYSSHSYTCGIEMMGNAQIMPMMYFQLNNIPLFKGGYLITDVEHTITKDGMKTTFRGARISKYQFNLSNKKYFILDFAEGDSDISDSAAKSSSELDVVMTDDTVRDGKKINYSKEDTVVIISVGHEMRTPGKQSPLLENFETELVDLDRTEKVIGDTIDTRGVLMPKNVNGDDIYRYREYWGNRKIATALTEKLREKGFKHVEPLFDDKPNSRGYSGFLSKESEFYEQNGGNCIVISIHSNALSPSNTNDNEYWTKANYWSIYRQSYRYAKGNTSRNEIMPINSEKSLKLAECILSSAKEIFAEYSVRNKRVGDKIKVKDGVQTFKHLSTSVENFSYCKSPAVLIENFFHNNKDNVQFLSNKENRDCMVDVIIDGIEKFIELQ